MSFEAISLLLNWLELGALLAILYRLGHTLELIASTQRELRRAIHRLGERRAAEQGIHNAFGGRALRWLLTLRMRGPALRAWLVPTIWPASRLVSPVEHLPVRSRRLLPAPPRGRHRRRSSILGNARLIRFARQRDLPQRENPHGLCAVR